MIESIKTKMLSYFYSSNSVIQQNFTLQNNPPAQSLSTEVCKENRETICFF